MSAIEQPVPEPHPPHPGLIYCDNGATSFPKAPGVSTAVANFIECESVNINRGTHELAYSVADQVLECRELISDLIGGNDPSRVIFTKNITEALNILLKGLLRPGEPLLLSALEHNAVARVAKQLNLATVYFSPLAPNLEAELLKLQKEHQARVLVMTHASNLSGEVFDIETVGKFCAEHDIYFIVDSAQTLGLIDINVEEQHISALAFTGHKALLGPQGIGGFYLADIPKDGLKPLIAGGTGSHSDELEMPPELPDCFEAGTQNLPGIIGLKTALGWVTEQTPAGLLKQELDLRTYFLHKLQPLVDCGAISILATPDWSNYVPIVAIDCLHEDNAKLAHTLAKDWQVMTRVGKHCTPLAHRFYGTEKNGALRFSFGHANTKSQIDLVTKALEELLGLKTQY